MNKFIYILSIVILTIIFLAAFNVSASTWTEPSTPPPGGNVSPPVGPIGPAGPSGPVGNVGPSGPSGPASTISGPSGPSGPIGGSGSSGPSGPSGPIGYSGPSGPSGRTGPSGPVGNIGPSGPSGPASTISGPSGPSGYSGPTGPAGTSYWTLSGTNLYPNNAGWNVGIGTTAPAYKLDVVSSGVTTARFGTVAGDYVVIGGGAGKITVGQIDPIFEIEGEKYATYMADFAGGARVETSGIVRVNLSYIINFDNLEKGSNLWLFWKASNQNIDDLVVILAPGFEGKVWYEKRGNRLIIYGDKSGEVSYRLSAPRIDYQNWTNLIKDQNITGIKVDDYEK